MEVKELEWETSADFGTLARAVLKSPDGTDGVVFELSVHPTCHRRGPYWLRMWVEGGPYHHAWGCLDEQDQPLRFYHLLESAQKEANAIAAALQRDFPLTKVG